MANDSIEEFHFFDLYTVANIGDENFFKNFDAKILNSPNLEGWTLLMYACNNRNFEFVDFLLKQGALTSIKSKDNKSPLIVAIGSGDLRSTKAVFSLDLLEEPDSRGWTPLFHAVYYGRETCAEFLLQQGADPHAVDKAGQTPISMAVKYGMESMVGVLLRSGISAKTPQKSVLNSPIVPTTSNTPKRGLNFFKPMRLYSPNSPRAKKDIKENLSPAPLQPTTSNTPQKKRPLPPMIKITTPNETNVTPIKENTLPTVLMFLTDIGMAKYYPIFQDEEVDFDTFITFDEVNLKEIGIHLYGPRRKIVMAIQEFRAMHGSGSRLLKHARWVQ